MGPGAFLVAPVLFGKGLNRRMYAAKCEVLKCSFIAYPMESSKTLGILTVLRLKPRKPPQFFAIFFELGKLALGALGALRVPSSSRKLSKTQNIGNRAYKTSILGVHIPVPLECIEDLGYFSLKRRA